MALAGYVTGCCRCTCGSSESLVLTAACGHSRSEALGQGGHAPWLGLGFRACEHPQVQADQPCPWGFGSPARTWRFPAVTVASVWAVGETGHAGSQVARWSGSP